MFLGKETPASPGPILPGAVDVGQTALLKPGTQLDAETTLIPL